MSEYIISGGLRTIGIDKPISNLSPLISVITVVYNSASTIECTINSVLTQNYENIEYIIVDGGSTDGTLDILKKYEDKIDLWVSGKDCGIYDAMNKGIRLCRGKYIGMLNADDFFSKNTVISNISNIFLINNVDAVFSNLDIIDPLNPNKILRKYRVPCLNRFLLRIGVMPAHPTFYCKKSLYEIAGPYDTSYRIAADFEMLVRLFLRHNIKCSFFNEVSIKMRSGGISNSGIKSKIMLNMEILRACSENGLYSNILLLLLKIPIRLIEKAI